MTSAGLPSRVPNYTISGHQHHRHPYKDKSGLAEEEIRHHKWLQPAPSVKTRSELQHARQRARVPDMTYDFDGDGVVGQLDHFVGRSFDKDNDGRLTTAERDSAQQALEQGFLNKYVRGFGAVEKALQRQGTFKFDDYEIEASMTSPSRFADQKHHSRSALHRSRAAEAKAASDALGERYARECAAVPEPQPPTSETEPRMCPISHIRERAEADHQARRVRGGLLPTNTVLNPERELKSVGLEHVERPYFATRGQLMETRKELMKRECEDLALLAEENCVPHSVRRMEREVREYEFRRPDHLPMTRTRLNDHRRKERIEHDMRHFSQVPRQGPNQYPRFSDQPEVPFWVADNPAAYQEPAMSRAVSEPALKVTEQPWGHAAREPLAESPDAAHRFAAGKSAGSTEKMGPKTVKRWTAEYIERGEGRNKPRLFDSIQQVRIGPKDLESLDMTSSMELIRNAASAKISEENKKHQGVPKRSRLWSDPSTTQSMGASMQQQEAAARSAQRSIIQSEPSLRTTHLREEIANEPRFFGSTTHINRPSSQTAIRSGGFQRVTAGLGSSIGVGTTAAAEMGNR